MFFASSFGGKYTRNVLCGGNVVGAGVVVVGDGEGVS
jgi:hypothetical protein